MRRHHRSMIHILSNVNPHPVNAAEVGVFTGDLSADLLRAFPELHLVMVDHWRPYRAISKSTSDLTLRDMGAIFRKARRRTEFAHDRRVIIIANSMNAADFLGDRTLDAVFIDACHWFEAVRLDLLRWWDKVRPGGVFSGHDYRDSGDKHGRGVHRAVHQFANQRGLLVRQARGMVWWIVKPLDDMTATEERLHRLEQRVRGLEGAAR
jgi:hypothetical protein